jgi:hypothetical protein
MEVLEQRCLLTTIGVGTDLGSAGWAVTGAGATAAPAMAGGGGISITSNDFRTGTFLRGGSVAAFNGLWYADRTFNLPADATRIALTFSGLAADDRVVLQLNGADIGDMGLFGPGPGLMMFPGSADAPFTFDGATSGTVTTHFIRGGKNDLRLVVNNTGDGFTAPTTTFRTDTDATAAYLTASVTYTEAKQLAVSITPSVTQVAPGGLIGVGVSATAAPGATEVTVTIPAPAGTTMFQGTAATPSVTFQAAGDQVDGHFSLKVAAVPQLPPGLRAVTILAHASATLADGTNIAQDFSQSVQLIPQLQVVVVPSEMRVHPSDTVSYRITVNSQDPGGPFSVTASVPAGTDVMPGSIGDGGVLGADTRGNPMISWKLPGGSQAETSFAVKVDDAKHLPKNITKLIVIARANAVIDGDTLTGEGHAQSSVQGPLSIDGKVLNVVLDFPNRTLVNTSRPLEGLTVVLKSADGQTTYDTETTDAGGSFEVTAPDPGTYLVQVSAPVDLYDDGSGKVIIGADQLYQNRTVTVNKNQTQPTQLKDILLPVALLDREAMLFQTLNALTVPARVGGLGNITGTVLKYHYNTSVAEAVVQRTVVRSANTPFTGIYTEKGAAYINAHPGAHFTDVKDDLNADIRLTAFMELLALRFSGPPTGGGSAQVYPDDIDLADQFAKATALFVTLQTMKALSKAKYLKAGSPTVTQLGLQAFKIDTLADTVGRIIPPLFQQLAKIDPKFNDPNFQAQVRNVIYLAVRFTFDAFTGQVKDDAVFEVIFDGLRLALLNSYQSLDINGGLPWLNGSQQALTDVELRARSHDFTGDTNQVLASLEQQDGNLTTEIATMLRIGSTAQAYINALRLSDGLTAAWVKIKGTSLGGPGGPNGTEVKGLLAGLDTLASITNKITAGPYALVIGLPLAELYLRDPKIRDMGRTAVGDVPGGSAAQQASVLNPNSAASARLKAPAGVSQAVSTQGDPAATAYLNLLATISREVLSNDVADYLGNSAQLVAAHGALFDNDWDFLSQRALLAIAQFPPNSSRATVLCNFATELSSTEQAVEYLYLDLQLWSIAPDTSSQQTGQKECATALASAVSAVQAVEQRADQSKTILTGASSPAYLVASESNPASVLGGQPVALTFIVTNVGKKPMAAGTATLNAAAGLRLVGTTSKTLPALLPGQSARFTWQATTESVTSDQYVFYDFQAVPSSGSPASVDDGVDITP